jgi:hypothetical protein
MKFPNFGSRKKIRTVRGREERSFAEASELAKVRLEQCIADLHVHAATTQDIAGEPEIFVKEIRQI